jgi:transcriptional regulator with XRE-family HTH domain
MTRTNLDGKPIKLVLSWLTNRELTDGELAEALGVDKTYYSRHKDDEDYPTFEDLATLAHAFGLSSRTLQISFGYRDTDELILLDHEGMRQYMELGGANWPNPDRDDVCRYVEEVVAELRQARSGTAGDAVPFSTTGDTRLEAKRRARLQPPLYSVRPDRPL